MNDRIFRILGLGLTAAAAAVVLAPVVAQAACPAVRRGMKTAFVAYMRGREAVAGLAEMVEDAYAEATAELKQEADAMAAADSAAAAAGSDTSGGESSVEKPRAGRS